MLKTKINFEEKCILVDMPNAIFVLIMFTGESDFKTVMYIDIFTFCLLMLLNSFLF